MTLAELQNQLESLANEVTPSIKLPDSQSIAPHFHLTEIGLEDKDFVDCGGTRRKLKNCVLQLLVGNDTDHRLSVRKFRNILQSGEKTLNLDKDIEIIVEITGPVTIERYGIGTIENSLITLTSLATACLATSSCGLDPEFSKFSLPAISSCGPTCC